MWLDDCDDLLVVLHVQRPLVIAAGVVLVACVAGAGLFMYATGHPLLSTH